MINQETTRKLHEMRLTSMVEALANQEHIENIRQMGFEDRLELLIDAAYDTRQNNKLECLIKDAGFSTTAPSISNIDYNPDRQLDKDVITKLATGAYIKAHHNVLIMGASGNGKTWLATALGIAACRQFYKVRYVRLPELMDDLLVAKNEANGDFKKILIKYGKYDLLIVDEWLLTAVSQEQATFILELMERRRRSTRHHLLFAIWTTGLARETWAVTDCGCDS